MDTDTYFSLEDYDSIGFDLDCTLAEYNVKELMKLIYLSLVDFLIKKRNYDDEIFSQPYEEKKYFMQKGLFMDLVKGNVLKINEKGEIVAATHGTTPLNEEQLLKFYGNNTASLLIEYTNNPLGMLYKSGNTFRACLDCFDMPSMLLYAIMVDYADEKNGDICEEYDFWQDIVSGLYHLYSTENFETNESAFFSALKTNPDLYYYKWTPEKLAWLREVKSKKFTFLITGSFVGFATFTASYCLGEDWKDYFHVVVTYARKPYFFFQSNPFIKLGIERGEIVVQEELQIDASYCQGNWKKLKALISRHTNVLDPKCLYIGDNMLQDVYASGHYNCCSCIAVAFELKDEFESDIWGSFFGSKKDGDISFWNSLLKGNAICCVSSLDVILKRPLNYKYNCLTREPSEVNETNGYYVD